MRQENLYEWQGIYPQLGFYNQLKRQIENNFYITKYEERGLR